jgi:gluconolactonase
MMKTSKIATLAVVFSLIAAGSFAQDKPLYDTLQKPQLISKQFAFAEGPATDKKGNIFFTDQPNNKIWKYDTDGKLSIFMEKAGRSNGMFFDKKGNLISGADEQDQMWSIDQKGNATVLIKDYNGKRLNGPNDVWVDRTTGGIYFTDPYYQRDYWERKTSELDGQKVYYLPKDGQLIIVEDQLKKPNGIVGTPDGKTLYVADIQGNKTYKYSIGADGKLSDKQQAIAQGSDGMTIDAEGNLYLCGKGVTIYSPAGKKLAHIDIPEPWTANICFGGKDKKLLFITASTAIYTLKMNAKGVE